MIIETKECILCGNKAEFYRKSIRRCSEYSCKDCGIYAVSDSFQSDRIKLHSLMRYYLKHVNKESTKEICFVSDNKNIQDDDYTYVDTKTLENLYPTTLARRVEMVMINLSEYIKVLGDRYWLSGIVDKHQEKNIYNMFLVDDICGDENLLGQVNTICDILFEMGLTANNSIDTFTIKGWEFIENIQEKQKELPQAFIAMSFSENMNSAKTKIIQAIVDSGYIPMIISDKEHNNQIVPEILFEIKRSKFVIADLTEHRNGVYYEAGYAQALDKEVIISCKSEDFGKTHFDVAQKNTVVWQDEDDLYERLLKRIESTIGINN